jgi:hypothetical protein
LKVTCPDCGQAKLVDDVSRLLQIRAVPEEEIMALADIGAIAALVIFLGGLGCFMYFRVLKH